MSITELYPWLAALAITITVGREVVNALRGKDWQETASAQKATIEALTPRIAALETEVATLKRHAASDKRMIQRRDRVIEILKKQVAKLTAALMAAGIPLPDLPRVEEEEDHGS